MMKSYKQLVVWQKSNDLVIAIYTATQKFPSQEKYGIISQIRRAALSVVLNIVEGYSRNTKGDYKRFLNIALGSLAEVEYLLELALNLKYLSQLDYDNLEVIRIECGKLLWAYRKKLD